MVLCLNGLLGDLDPPGRTGRKQASEVLSNLLRYVNRQVAERASGPARQIENAADGVLLGRDDRLSSPRPYELDG
jgi:hypothetical protein